MRREEGGRAAERRESRETHTGHSLGRCSVEGKFCIIYHRYNHSAAVLSSLRGFPASETMNGCAGTRLTTQCRTKTTHSIWCDFLIPWGPGRGKGRELRPSETFPGLTYTGRQRSLKSHHLQEASCDCLSQIGTDTDGSVLESRGCPDTPQWDCGDHRRSPLTATLMRGWCVAGNPHDGCCRRGGRISRRCESRPHPL